MAKKLKVGHKFTNANGDKVVITSILPNGAATINYAAGSGKTGYAGMIPGNMLTKFGTMFSSKVQKEILEPEDLEWNNREFSYEEYESFTEEKPDEDPTEILKTEVAKAQSKNLANVDEVINDELMPLTRGKENFIDTRHLVRSSNQVIRYLLKEYASAYGASEEFDLASKKLSTVYHMSQAGGYHHAGGDNVVEKMYEDPKVFYPDFEEAIMLLKNRSATETDLEQFRAKIGLCKYGFGHIQYSQGQCDSRCTSDAEKYVTYDLPKPVF